MQRSELSSKFQALPNLIQNDLGPDIFVQKGRRIVEPRVIRENTKSIWASIYSHTPSFFVGKLFKVVKLISFAGVDLKKIQEISAQELKDRIKDERLLRFLDEIAPKIALSFRDKMLKDEHLKYSFANEYEFMVDLVRALLPKAIVGLDKHRRSSENSDQALITYLIRFVDKKFAEIQKEMDSVDSNLDFNTYKRKRDQLFTCFSKELLGLFFPQGAMDLPLAPGIRSFVWSNLENVWLPQLLIECYEQLFEFSFRSREEELLKLPGGNLLITLCKISATKVSELFSRTLSAKSDLLSEQLNIKDDGLKDWLKGLLDEVDKNSNSGIVKVSRFLSTALENVLTHVAFRLIKDSTVSEDAGKIVLRRIFDGLSIYLMSNRDKIEKRKSDLLAAGKDPMQDPEWIGYFQEIGLSFKSSLYEEKEFCLPKLLSQIIEEIFRVELPQVLAKNYENILLPLGELYNEIMNSSHMSQRERLIAFEKGGRDLADICAIIGKIAAKKVQKILTNNTESISEKIVSYINLSDLTFNNYIKNIFQNKIHEAVTSNDLLATNVWHFIQNSTEAVLIYILLNMSEKYESKDRHILVMVLGRLLNLFANFDKKYGKEISIKYEELFQLGQIPTENEAFFQLFKPLAEDLMNEVGAEDLPLPLILKWGGNHSLKAALPLILSTFYYEYRKEKNSREKYKTLFESLFELEGGNGAVVRSFEELLSEIVNKVVFPSLETFWKNQFLEGIEKTEGVREFWDQHLKDCLEVFLLKTIVNFATHTQQRTHVSGEKLPVEMLGSLVKIFTDSPLVDEDEIKRANAIVDPMKRKKAYRRAFSRISSHMLQQGSPLPPAPYPPLQDLPIPDPFKEKLWDLIEKKLLPDLLAEFYFDFNLWCQEAEFHQKELEGRFKSSLPTEACSNLSEKILRTYSLLSKNHKEELLNCIPIRDVKCLSQHHESVKKMIDEGIQESLKSAYPWLKKFLNSALLKILNNLSHHIENTENPKSEYFKEEFLTQLVVRLVSISGNYFGSLNKIRKENGKSSIADVTDEDIYESPGEGLHPCILISNEAKIVRKKVREIKKNVKHLKRKLSKMRDPQKIEEIRMEISDAYNLIKEERRFLDQKRLEKFFIPLSKKILMLSGIHSSQDLAVPSALKNGLWESLQKDILPQILLKLFDQLMEPPVRYKILLSILEKIIARLDSPLRKKVTKCPRDVLQAELEEVCGNLLESASQVIPKSVLKIFFRIKKIKDLSAEALAKIVRKELIEAGTALELTRRGLEAGTKKMNSTSDWRVEDNKTTKKKIKRAMLNVAKKMTTAGIRDFMSSPWKKLHRKLNCVVRYIAGDYGLKIKDVVDGISRKIFIDILSRVTSPILTSFEYAFWFLPSFYLFNKSEVIIRSCKKEIHEDFLYKAFDEVVSFMESSEKQLKLASN